jgi:hypothetical protein
MCERDKLQNCNFEQCQELEDKYGDYTYDTQQHRCINKFIDLNVKELTIKDEVSQLVKSVREEEENAKYELLAAELNRDIEHICKVASESGTCDDHRNVPGVCNSFKEDNIPCYYDHVHNKCNKVTEKYAHDWNNISNSLGKLLVAADPTQEFGTAEDFLKCADPGSDEDDSGR